MSKEVHKIVEGVNIDLQFYHLFSYSLHQISEVQHKWDHCWNQRFIQLEAVVQLLSMFYDELFRKTIKTKSVLSQIKLQQLLKWRIRDKKPIKISQKIFWPGKNWVHYSASHHLILAKMRFNRRQWNWR